MVPSFGSGFGGTGRATAFISFKARLAVSLGAGAVLQAVASRALSTMGIMRTSFIRSSFTSIEAVGRAQSARVNNERTVVNGEEFSKDREFPSTRLLPWAEPEP